MIDLADFVYSTAGMCKHPDINRAREYIIGTEVGMIYRLKKAHPDREFYPLSDEAICQNIETQHQGGQDEKWRDDLIGMCGKTVEGITDQ